MIMNFDIIEMSILEMKDGFLHIKYDSNWIQRHEIEKQSRIVYVETTGSLQYDIRVNRHRLRECWLMYLLGNLLVAPQKA